MEGFKKRKKSTSMRNLCQSKEEKRKREWDRTRRKGKGREEKGGIGEEKEGKEKEEKMKEKEDNARIKKLHQLIIHHLAFISFMLKYYLSHIYILLRDPGNGS